MGFSVNFDGGYARNSLDILFQAYLFEHDDSSERQKLEDYLESNFPEEYKKFKEYEHKVEERTLILIRCILII